MVQDHVVEADCRVGIHSRVTVPEGRTSTVVGTRSKIVHGQMNPLGYQVRLDGTQRDGPHPWFLAGVLTVQTPTAADPPSLSNPIASEPGSTPL